MPLRFTEPLNVKLHCKLNLLGSYLFKHCRLPVVIMYTCIHTSTAATDNYVNAPLLAADYDSQSMTLPTTIYLD